MSFSTLGLGAASSDPVRPKRPNHQRLRVGREHAFVRGRCAHCGCRRDWPLGSMACPAANATAGQGGQR